MVFVVLVLSAPPMECASSAGATDSLQQFDRYMQDVWPLPGPNTRIGGIDFIPPEGLSLAGESAYVKFIRKLEPGDYEWDAHGRWVVHDKSKIIGLLMDLPFCDYSAGTQRFMSDMMDRVGVDLSPDAALGTMDRDIVDAIDLRFEEAVGERRAHFIRLGLSVAYGMKYGGRVRLGEHRWGDAHRLKLSYTYDPGGDNFPDLRYEFKPNGNLSWTSKLAPDSLSLGLQHAGHAHGRPATIGFSGRVSEDGNSAYLWWRMALP